MKVEVPQQLKVPRSVVSHEISSYRTKRLIVLAGKDALRLEVSPGGLPSPFCLKSPIIKSPTISCM